VPLSESSRVTVGASGWMKAGGTGAPDLALKVVSRPAQVEQGTAAIPVRLAFVTPPTLTAGTPAQVDIDAERHTNVVLVPSSAIAREGEDTAVFVVMGDTAHRRPVQVGLDDGTDAEIASGVKAGEMVIVQGQAGLPDGAKISVETDEDDEKAAPDEKKDDEKESGKK